MAENEPTLEELMAELDAGLDLNDNTSETKPNESEDAKGVTADNTSGDEMDTDNFEAELERMAETPVPAPAPEPAPAPAPAPALASTAPAQPVAALTAVEPEKPAAQPKIIPPPKEEAGRPLPRKDEQRTAEIEGAASSVSSWWSSVKASAEGLIASDGITVDTSALNADYQRGKEASMDAAYKLSNLFVMASQEMMSTAADVAASARTMNSKILLKPQASFGVPLELIVKRECGDEDAAAVPVVLESLLSLLEQKLKENGGAALDVTLLTDMPDDELFAKVESFRDMLDVGESVEAIELSSEPIETTAALFKLFLLEMPGPLLTHACYADFVNALLYEGGASCATDVADLMPPVHRAVTKRLLSFLRDCFITSCADLVSATAAEDRVALAVGPWLLRSSFKERQTCMLHVLQVKEATKVLLKHGDYIFRHTCWFLRPWMGVYALRLTSGDKEKEDSDLWSELTVDAPGMEWENKKAKCGSEVDATGWGRIPMRTADAVRSMVAAAKFEDRTLVLCFAGDWAQDGLAEIEEVVIEEGADGLGLQERITRRFTGRFLRPLPWQEQIEKWAAQNVGLAWDEELHASEVLELWRLSMPGTDPPARKDPRWNLIGFQQQDPATDFRGAGMLPLKELMVLAKSDTQHYCAMLARSKGDSPEHGYPFACGAINVVYMLLELLLLLPGKRSEATAPSKFEDNAGVGCPKDRFPNKRGTACRRALGMLLSHDSQAFSVLFAASMQVLDDEWMASSRSYLNFNQVLSRVLARVRATLRDPNMSSPEDLTRLLKIRP